MQAEKILVPVDFSTRCTAALEMATDLAIDSGAMLLIAHVEEPPLTYRGDEFSYGLDRLHQGPSDIVHGQVLRELAKIAPADPRVRCEHHLLTGEPISAIVRFAQEHHIDLIVIGTHGWTGWRRMLLGSQAESIVRRAPCPVITVKSRRDAAATSN